MIKSKEKCQMKKQQTIDPNKPKKSAGSYFLFRVKEGFVGVEARHQQLHHYCSDFCEMEAATDDKQQPQKELVEEEEHTTHNIIAGAKDARPKKNRSKRVIVSRTVEYT
ncbi:hypothetical protein Q3G72_010856 [Acer saccharum]|nr:hypothetical protein Q3G72_010856 [Acer saccharum]